MDPSRQSPFTQQRPGLPSASSSASSSASQSSSSLSSLATSAAFPASASSHSQYSSQPSQSATSTVMSQPPLQQFGSLHPSSAAPSQHQLQRQTSYEYQPARSSPGNTATETAVFLSGSSLIAEAAKRAQMAVLMRDLEGVEL